MPTDISILTSYHSAVEQDEAFARLKRSLRSSLEELDGAGRLILVANGTNDARVPRHCQVLAGLPVSGVEVVPVSIPVNAGAAGALNAAVRSALDVGCSASHFLVSVQSSAVLQRDWLCEVVAALGDAPSALGAFGRLVHEAQPEVVWADGHYLSRGIGKNVNLNQKITDTRPTGVPCAPPKFPCLSAAAFRASAVRAVVDEYGAFVTSAAPHYGDCPDAALRLHAVSGTREFSFVPKAVARKRTPVIDGVELEAARIVFSTRHYSGRGSVYRKSPAACCRANMLLKQPYGDAAPPLASCFDPW